MDKFVKYKNLNDNITIASIFFVTSLTLTILMGLVTLGKFPTMLWTSLVYISVFSSIIFLLPSRVARAIVCCLLLLVQTIIAVVNDILFRVTGEIFTIAKLKLMNEATGAFDKSLINPWTIVLFLSIFILALLGVILIRRKQKVFKATVKQFCAMLMTYIFLLCLCFSCGFTSMKEEDKEVYYSQSTLTYQKHGFYTFYASDIYYTIKNSIFKYDVSEKKDEYLQYFQQGEEDTSNEFTGISEGNNVLMILMESLDIVAIDEYFTPNLYKLIYQDGLYFTNYFAENKTNMSEGLALAGIYSKSKPLATNTDEALSNLYGEFALPNLLKQKDKDLKTTYLHGLRGVFYKRETTFDNLGFDNLIFTSNQQEEINQYNKQQGDEYDWTPENFYSFVKDTSFIGYNLEQVVPSEGRFFTAYATIASHGTYEERGSNKENYKILTSEENKVHYNKMITSLEEKGFNPNKILDKFLYYKAGVMDLDKTIGMIFDRLEETNNLDKTTVVLYPDHNAYYDDVSYKIRNIEGAQIRECNVLSYNLPCVIYDQKLIKAYKGEETYTGGAMYDEFVSVADIYPTLCNLLGIKYNTKIVYGQDMFKTTEHVFISLKDHLYIFNDKFYFFDNKVIPVSNIEDDGTFLELAKARREDYKIKEDLFKDIDTFHYILNNLKTA